jgi:hypothetical protein
VLCPVCSKPVPVAAGSPSRRVSGKRVVVVVLLGCLVISALSAGVMVVVGRKARHKPEPLPPIHAPATAPGRG